MTQLTNRQRTILGYLLHASVPIPVRDLANRCGFSERTIRYDLDHIQFWLRLQNSDLTKRPNSGVQIFMDQKTRLEWKQAFSQGDNESCILTPEERKGYIYHTLLFSQTATTAENLSQKMLVSRPTVVNDLKSLHSWLSSKELTLEGKKGEGYRIEGTESVFRSRLVEALEAILAEDHCGTRYGLTNRTVRGAVAQDNSVRSMALSYLGKVDLDALDTLLTLIRETALYTIPEKDYVRLLLYLSVTIRRAWAGRGMPSSLNFFPESGEKETSLAALLVERMEKRFRLVLGNGETAQLAIWLISCNINLPPGTEDKKTDPLATVVDHMLEALASFPDCSMPEFYKDKLKRNLLSHLRLTMKKHALGLSSPNPLLSQVKVNYPGLFAIACKMADVFLEETGIPLREVEIGFITIHVAASLEECNKLYQKKAVIVCNTGRGAAAILYNRIRNNIPLLEILGTVAALDAEHPETLEEADFVISTVALPDIGLPVFRVSPIISAMDIAHISQYLNGTLNSHLPEEQQNAQKQLFQEVLKVTDRYVIKEKREKYKTELREMLDSATIPRTSGEKIAYEEKAVFQCSMILAELGSLVAEQNSLLGGGLDQEKLFGMAIHILMSIPRWRKGSYNQETETTTSRYQNTNPQLYEAIVQKLQAVSRQYDLTIPPGEAVAFMRYFL